MKIELYNGDVTPEIRQLLLMADPSEASVDSYVPEADMLICREASAIVGVAVLVHQQDQCELKNIAVHTEYQGQGLAKLLIAESLRVARSAGARLLEVGTGNSSLSQLALYQKCGFRMHRIDSGFFESYPEPIIENGIRCLDMVRLRLQL